MAVYFDTPNARHLYAAFENAVHMERGQRGAIHMWKVVKASDQSIYFTHREKPWERLAFFRPTVEEGRLTFHLIAGEGHSITRPAYSFYHGHMVASFINFFPMEFTVAHATPRPAIGDSALSA